MSQPSTPSPSHCTSCHDLLPAGYQPGLCPVCLMDVAMHPTHDGTLPVAPPQKPLTPEDLQPHFPQLEILECIGRGGMGVVYKARQKALDRLVALKLLAPGQTKDAAFATRFAHEARALAALNHPNIVTVHDFGESGGFYYLLMEFVDGVNLRQAMRGSHLSPEQALSIVPPICEALQYAHEQGIVHRDIKPENLLLDKAGRVKIADFGIAKMLSVQNAAPEDAAMPEGAARSTVVAGTPQYMAPEQRKPSAQADHRVDIYSLGVVLYELLTGELPAGQIQMADQGAMTDVRLDEIVRRALEQDPAQRYQTIAELQTQLATVTRGTPAAQVWPRAGYEHRLSRALHAAGVLWMLYAVGRLLASLVNLRTPSLKLPSQTSTLWLALGGTGVLCAAAWGLIRWRAALVRASYRPLTVPPGRIAEAAAFAVRLFGLWLALDSLGGLMEFIKPLDWGYKVGQGLLCFAGASVFFFEHAISPIFHAVPVWRPLPFVDRPSRRAVSGHAVSGGLLLALLLWMVILAAQIYVKRLAEATEWKPEMAENLTAGLARMAWLAALVSVLGWAAVARIRRSGGRLLGMAAATAAAAALPLLVVFTALTYFNYVPTVRLNETFSYQADGTLQGHVPQQPELLAELMLGAGAACLVLWLCFWLWVRKAAPPPPALHPARRLGAATTLVWFMAFAAPGWLILGFSIRKVPHAPIPADQFARHVERQLNLRLFATGHQHSMPQGYLTLPRAAHTDEMLQIRGLRDPDGHEIKGRVRLHWQKRGVQESIRLDGEEALQKLQLHIDRNSPFALRREMVLPSPVADDDCLWCLRSLTKTEAPADLRQRLMSGTTALTPEDHAWLAENRVHLVLDPQEEGALRILGATALMTEQSPADFGWLTLDDRQVAAALMKARAARPADGGFTRIRERSPAVVAFVTHDNACGLLENCGPSKPGAKDARLRVTLFTNPFR